MRKMLKVGETTSIDLPENVVATVTRDNIQTILNNPAAFLTLLKTYSFCAETYVNAMTDNDIEQLIANQSVLEAWVHYVCSFDKPLQNQTEMTKTKLKKLTETSIQANENHDHWGRYGYGYDHRNAIQSRRCIISLTSDNPINFRKL